MALFNWLFGKFKSRAGNLPTSADGWTLSENGNPMLVEGSLRVTVFQWDCGWKYCIADVDDQEESYFSEVYANEQAAREEAFVHLHGEPSHRQPLSDSIAEDRRERWEAHIRERTLIIEEVQCYLTENSDLGITALRKPEAKIASHLKQLEWQVAEYHRVGVSMDLISLAERQRALLAKLAEKVAASIKAKQARRSPRKAPVSNSQLSSDLANKVDELIRLFADSPVVDNDQRELLHLEAKRANTAKMLDEDLTYGQASGAPDFLNQDEESFRTFMKQVDQDLAWQCETVTAAFEQFLKTGEIPAPHYPMRVAILLRKAKDLIREKQFLAAWCKHFPPPPNPAA